MSYPSDLSDARWAKIEPFFARPDPRGAREKYPQAPRGRGDPLPPARGLPLARSAPRFPPYDAVFDHWQRWQERGVWQKAVAVLGVRWREVELGRGRRGPRHALLDSQSVKSAAEGQARGFHGGEKVKGRSRHVAVDSQGTLLAVHVTAANKADGAEAGAVMVQACERHPSLESFTADGSYQRQAEKVAREQLGVELHVTAKPKVPKPSRHRLKKGALRRPASAGASSAPSPGLGQCRLLSKEYEKTVKSAEAWLWCAMMRLLIRRLAI